MGRFINKPPRTGFSRPATNLEKVERHWKDVPVQELDLGDIVAGMGIVKTISPTCNNTIYVEAGEGNTGFFEYDMTFLAFVKKEVVDG
jgi:hypothetical protein